nr:EOG090X0IRX [Triops cancriformis]
MASNKSKKQGKDGADERMARNGVGDRPCVKVFIQRDYSEGTAVRFQCKFPGELEGKLEKDKFEYTVNTLNEIYQEAEALSCSTYCEGCCACLTGYLLYCCTDTHYEKCLKKAAKFIIEQNERVWVPRGLLLVDPVERGLRVVSFYENDVAKVVNS